MRGDCQAALLSALDSAASTTAVSLVGVRESIQRLFKGVRDSLIRAAYVGRTTWFEILFAHA